jgi:hypothetical protein
MAKNSTPESRADARDNAEVIGAAERVVHAEIRSWATRVANHWSTPTVAVFAFFGFIGLAVHLVESINL